MITHISGKLVEKSPTNVVVDCNGLGYFIHISLHTFSQGDFDFVEGTSGKDEDGHTMSVKKTIKTVNRLKVFILD